MSNRPKSLPELRETLLDAALVHVPFDGWSDQTFQAAIDDTGLDRVVAQAACPRGGVDLALAYHARGDEAMRRRMNEADLTGLRFRDKVTLAVRKRIESITDKEAVRRGTTLFALPQYASDGAKAIWGTADAIWDLLGDTSRDFNWYSKRATLSGVYGATILFWLGDDSEDHNATWAFLDRRIEDVMRIEKVKAQVNDNALLKPFLRGPNWLLSQIKAPQSVKPAHLPGHIAGYDREPT